MYLINPPFQNNFNHWIKAQKYQLFERDQDATQIALTCVDKLFDCARVQDYGQLSAETKAFISEIEQEILISILKNVINISLVSYNQNLTLKILLMVSVDTSKHYVFQYICLKYLTFKITM